MDSIVSFRARVRTLLESAAGDTRLPDVAILALDGIPQKLATASWPSARIEAMQSVFPTTSATGWLSSLKGAGVETHGVPGAVFRLDEAESDTIDVFAHRGQLGGDADGSLFSDAAALGWEPLAIVGDLEPWNCAWRDLLLRDARPLWGWPFFIDGIARPAAESLCKRLRGALEAAFARPPSGPPRLVWCFLDVDHHVHRHGYDDCVRDLLAGVERIAEDLVARGVHVVAHADHGLVPTHTDPALAQMLAGLEQRGCMIGGAGRTRWIYPRAGTSVATLRHELEAVVPAAVRVCDADDLFAPKSLARRRVGDLVLIAEGEAFVTSPGYRYDHGSLQQTEVEVPCAHWHA